MKFSGLMPVEGPLESRTFNTETKVTLTIYVWAYHPAHGFVEPRLAIGPNEEWWVVRTKDGRRHILPEHEVETRRTLWNPRD